MIRIRKLKPSEMPWFRRRWEVVRESDVEEFELMGYFTTWHEAMEYASYGSPRIVVLQ